MPRLTDLFDWSPGFKLVAAITALLALIFFWSVL